MSRGKQAGWFGLVALVGTLSGVFWLHGIFVSEKNDALAAIRSRRQALSAYAKQQLLQRLDSAWQERRKHLAEALLDPLQPASELLIVQGKQVLPRRWLSPSTEQGPTLLQILGRGEARSLAAAERRRRPDSPWAKRLEDVAALEQAAAAGERQPILDGLLAYLAHRRAYTLEAQRDLVSHVQVLRAVAASVPLGAQFWQRALRDGLPGAHRTHAGLQRQLLLARGMLSANLLQQLGAEVVALSRRYGVPYADFQARLAESPGADVKKDVAIKATDFGPRAVALQGGWYLVLDGDRIAGMPVDLPEYSNAIAASMRKLGLLQLGESIGLVKPLAKLPEDLVLRIHSPRWAKLRRHAESRYRLKALLEALVVLLFAGINLLIYSVYVRRKRFVDVRGKFVSAVSHELRTPLAAMRAMAETIERRTRGMQAVKDYPKRIIRDADRLGLLVENILSFNRIEGGNWSPKVSDVPVAEVVERIGSGLASTAKLPVDLQSAISDELRIRADRELFVLLISNLLHNALKYCERAKACVKLRAEVGAVGVTIWVSDNARGIGDDEAGRIFDEFYRGSADTTRGSGLGLAICERIMTAHGGRIELETSSSEGSVFRLHFPV